MPQREKMLNQMNAIREEAERAWRLSFSPSQESDKRALRDIARCLTKQADDLATALAG